VSGNIYGKGDRGKATRLHAQIVRARGRCECPDSRRGVAIIHSGQLQCMHIISRRHAATRTDLDNALAGCAACHRFFTENPVEWTDFIIGQTGRAKYELLWLKAHTPTKVDWRAEVARLTAIAKTEGLL